jgi:hypothetical protein
MQLTGYSFKVLWAVGADWVGCAYNSKCSQENKHSKYTFLATGSRKIHRAGTLRRRRWGFQELPDGVGVVHFGVSDCCCAVVYLKVYLHQHTELPAIIYLQVFVADTVASSFDLYALHKDLVRTDLAISVLSVLPPPSSCRPH